MAAALEETPVSYEDLADIERDFDDAETEISMYLFFFLINACAAPLSAGIVIISDHRVPCRLRSEFETTSIADFEIEVRQQVALTAPLYARRTKTVSQIPNFWPLVLEQAPPDIDQYIQPSDSALLLSSLLSFSVEHFEISSKSNTTSGDPRSVSIRFEFSPNEYFSDTTLEKKFWYRRSKDGWSGLVSEPVRIQWKKDRDLTGGLLDMVCSAWEVEQTASDGTTKPKELTPQQKALKKKIENTGMGGLSFFAWFGFIGRKISAEESAEAMEKDKEMRKNRKNKSPPESADGDAVEDEEEDDEEDDEEDLDLSLEIFPDGDELAIAFTEDLWPSAIKYFTQAQEQDALSDADFESDDEEAPNLVENSDEESEPDLNTRPAKKQRSG
ncbi:NAP family protein-like protein [Halenospora varia]|nr:NAP family protein-like protein [Halenospora varia]